MTRFGQNFLVDTNVANREIDYAEINKDDIVLEIGPGKGILTRLLAQHAKKIIAVEIDSKLADKLSNDIPDNVTIINDDILKVDFNNLGFFNKVVSNLPFQISSPFTFKLLDYPFSKAVLIYQKDFADRMIAVPNTKDYSRLSVGIYVKTYCRILENVSRDCFYPVPKVDSCIVELIPRKIPPFQISDEAFFFRLVKDLFVHRRKKIKGILRGKYNLTDLPYLDNRVEELTPEQIGELCNILNRL